MPQAAIREPTPLRPPLDAPASAPLEPPRLTPRQISVMERLELRSQPYIVIATAIAATIRGFYLFTDKLVNLSHYPAFNIPLSIMTGLIMSITSELTISIAGRRHKRYKALLRNAKFGRATATKATRELWQVEVDSCQEQVNANLWAMRISMGMSLVAAASYLIDSTGASGFGAFAIASALAGYVLYMMYYHGVQTEEIPEDGTKETAQSIKDALNVMRVEAATKLRAELQVNSMTVPARLALIASALPVPDQRMIMPTVKLLLNPGEPDAVERDDETITWWNMRQLALACGEDFAAGRKADDITRKFRRRCADNAEKHRDTIRMHITRGWVVEPSFAKDFWGIPDAVFESMLIEAERSTAGIDDTEE